MTNVMYADQTGCAIFKEGFLGDQSPFTDPVNNLGNIYFHSSNDYYTLAFNPTTVSINHAAIAAAPTFTVFSDSLLVLTTRLQRTKTDILLFTHNLGYKPHYMVCDSNGFAIPNGFPIQTNVGGHRDISTYATTTEIRLLEIAAPGVNSLPLLTKAYTIYVFKDVVADPLKPMLEIDPINAGSVIFGQGKFDLTYSMLRRIVGAEVAALFIPAGRQTDIANGCSRFIQANGTITDLNGSVASSTSVGGTQTTAIAYTGSYTGVAAIQAITN